MENEILTRRLRLSRFIYKDYQLFHKLNVDPFVRKFIWDDEIISIDTSKEIMNKNDTHFREDKYGIWKVYIKETKELIGYTGLWYFFEERQPQLIYALIERYTKKGYAMEFSKAIIQYSFNTLGFKYLLAAIDEAHLESRKVAERLGMKYHEERVLNDKPTLFFKIEKG